jgi:hypothetical protein
MTRRLPPEERLDILRKIDRKSGWSSLDDQRTCLICDRLFTGRQIEIDPRKSGYTLHCPTPGCPSHFTHWSATIVRPSRGDYQAVDDEQQSFSFLFEDAPFDPGPDAQPAAERY